MAHTWIPINARINHDPEIIKLRKKFGHVAVLIWIELLTMAFDNNRDGEIRGGMEEIINELATVTDEINVHRGRRLVRQIFDRFVAVGCVEIPQNTDKSVYKKGGVKPKQGKNTDKSVKVKIAKWGKYHKIVQKTTPLHTDRHTDKEGKAPKKTTEEKGTEPWRGIADLIYESDKPKFARLVLFINWAKKQGYTGTLIAKTLERFWVMVKKKELRGDWWPYLMAVMKKLYHEDQQSEAGRMKEEELKFLKTMIDGVGQS